MTVVPHRCGFSRVKTLVHALIWSNGGSVGLYTWSCWSLVGMRWNSLPLSTQVDPQYMFLTDARVKLGQETRICMTSKEVESARQSLGGWFPSVFFISGGEVRFNVAVLSSIMYSPHTDSLLPSLAPSHPPHNTL